MINNLLTKYLRYCFISCVTVTSLVNSFKALAQITPDTTLPNNSSVRLENNTTIIEDGTTVEGNLFHSFRDFSVINGSEAFFNNTIDIKNIITRVTGQSISNIDGIIKASGEASLFLINPNGIIFGENARLDIGGSFVGSTANAIGFGNLGNFSATNPEAPTELLTINPSALLFNQIQTSSIENNSIAASGRNPSNTFTARGLRVPDGKSLLLVGGDVSINGGGLSAFGGQVELGGLAGIGTVGLNRDGGNLSLSFPSGVERSDVSLRNNARVDVRAGNGGSITVNARNLEMTSFSGVLAGIESRLGSNNSKAGNIDINATGEIFLQRSAIFNTIQNNTLGQGGDVNIRANTLRLIDGAQVSVNTLGAGQSGNLTVDASSKVEVIGRNTDDSSFPTGLLAQQFTPGATGNAGNLTINTPLLRVLDGANVSVTTGGAGRGGNLKIDAGIIEVIGRSSSGSSSSIAAQATSRATGAAGNLTINTDQLIVRDGGQVSASTFGAGRGGDLKIDASIIEVIGISSSGSGSSISVQANSRATGAAGNLTINTDQLIARDGGQVSAGTFGAGQGGNLKIDASSLIELIGRNSVNSSSPSSLFAQQETEDATGNAGSLTINTPLLRVLDGAAVSTGTSGAGRGGDLKIDASIIEVIGISRSGFPSIINSGSNPKATGAAGNLTINTDQLIARDGGQVSAGTFGAGRGGDLKIDASSLVELIGRNAVNNSPSGLFAQQSTEDATGNAGNLTINTPLLRVLDGASVSAGTFGAGRGGDLIIDAAKIEVIGTSSDGFSSLITAQADPTATGEAGNLAIKTRELLVRDGAVIAVRSLGTGTAGNLTVDADKINLDNNATLSADTRSNRVDVDQATININSQDLILRRGSNITTNATGSLVIGGNININTDILALLENSNITANSANSRGGNINIRTQGLFQTPGSRITASGATNELSGNININTLEDPGTGLVEIPINLVDASNQISNACAPGSRQFDNTFVATGRGGLPISPTESLQDASTLNAWVKLAPTNNTSVRKIQPNISIPIAAPTIPTIIEASGWIADNSGNIELVAPTSQASPTWHSVSCPVSH